MIKFKNMTPHEIKLNDGRTFPSEGIARVRTEFSKFNSDGICSQEFRDIEGMFPFPEFRSCGECKGKGLDSCVVAIDAEANCANKVEVVYIVSAIVLAAAKAAGITDCVAPATGHPDTVRNEKGHIVSVPGFVK